MLIILLSLICCEAAVSAARMRIAGGVEAVPHAYPYQVALFIDDNFCGGSLISPNYVLTAAHCAVEISSTAEIILGAHNVTDTESTQVRRASSKIIIHKNYNETSFRNDIALLRLSEPAPINNFIQTIPLVSQSNSQNTFVNQIVTSTGWGLEHDIRNPTIKNMSPVLRVVNVPVLNLKTCKAYYKDDYYHIEFVTPKNICTNGANRKGTCLGDSGGPLVLNGTLIGITSSGAELCEISAPSVFTHVGKYLDWISRNSDVKIN